MNVSEVLDKNASKLEWASKTVENPTIDVHTNTTLQVVEIVALAAIFIVAILGNGAVLLALYHRQKSERNKLTRIYFFILHLTIADLITAVLNVLPQLLWKMTYRFAGGSALCKAVKFGQSLGPYLMSYVLIATAIDRYQAVCQPLLYCASSSRRSRTMLCLAWMLSLGFCIPQVTIFSYQELSPAVHDCWASFPRPWGERIYVTWYSMSVFIIPLLLLLVIYSRICHKIIWRSASRHRINSDVNKARVNTIRQTVAVIIIYVTCSTPFICALLWASWDNKAHLSNMWAGSVLTTLTLLSSINSCVNPLLYIGFNPALQRALSELFKNCMRVRQPLPKKTKTDQAWRLQTLTRVEEIEEKGTEVQRLNENTL